jgi:hypothetical protein
MSNIYVDIKGWQAKSRAVKIELSKAITKSLDAAADDNHRRIIKNLSGASYTPGSLPVTRVMGTLARAQKKERLNFNTRKLWSDSNVANYNQYVHWGTKYLKPRRFQTDEIAMNRANTVRNINNTISNAIIRVGR